MRLPDLTMCGRVATARLAREQAAGLPPAHPAKEGTAYGITADLADRMQAERVCQQLAAEHADATLLVNAAGLFVPKPFLDHDAADYDSYAELNRAIFFITQTAARGSCTVSRPAGLRGFTGR